VGQSTTHVIQDVGAAVVAAGVAIEHQRAVSMLPLMLDGKELIEGAKLMMQGRHMLHQVVPGECLQGGSLLLLPCLLSRLSLLLLHVENDRLQEALQTPQEQCQHIDPYTWVSTTM
jgi:hypothetical protein